MTPALVEACDSVELITEDIQHSCSAVEFYIGEKNSVSLCFVNGSESGGGGCELQQVYPEQ